MHNEEWLIALLRARMQLHRRWAADIPATHRAMESRKHEDMAIFAETTTGQACLAVESFLRWAGGFDEECQEAHETA